jgi:hypothetical protein
MMSGNFTVRIELVAGTQTRLDYISFDELPNSGIGGGQTTTWGGIKRLYR